MIDELVYSEFAKSFATSGHYLLRGQPAAAWSYLYPGVISPAWFAHPMSTTYGFAKAINAVAMTSAAIPVFFWTSRLAPRRYAVIAVVLLLLMPAYYYTAMLMTENLFLPAFVLAAFASALALERPTLLRQFFALGAVALLTAVRFQGVVFLAVVALAALVKFVLDLRVEGSDQWRRGLARLARFWPSAILVLLAGVSYVLWKHHRGEPLSTGVGTYQAVFTGGYSFSTIVHWLLYHFAELPLTVAVVPASAFLLLLGIALVSGTANEAERAFLAVTTAALVCVVAEVAAYASRFSFRVEERYMFGLAPLLLIAFVVWLGRGVPRPPALTAIAAAVPALLLLTLPLGRLLNISILSDTFGLIPFLRLSEKLHGVSDARAFLLVGGAVAALAFAFVPRRLATTVLPVAMAAFLVLSSYSVHGAIRDYSRGLRDAAGLGGNPSWIDDAVGSNRAAFLFTGSTNTGQESSFLWQAEFWNRSIKDFYDLDVAEPVPLGATTALTTERSTGRLVTAPPRPLPDEYVVTESSVQLAGRRIATHGPLSLYRIAKPLHLSSLVEGVYGDGWTGAEAAITRFAPVPHGTVVVTLSRNDWRGPNVPGRVRIELRPLKANGSVAGRATVRTWVAHSGKARTFRFPAPTRPFEVQVHVSPTFSPARFGVADTRQLGVEASFAVRPRRHG
jgi:hypothetical protein